jgi:hypothetical protein
MTSREAKQRRAAAITKADARRMTRYALSEGGRTQNAKVWNAMRMLRAFTAGDLMAVCEIAADTGPRGKVPGTLRRMLSVFKASGFLAMTHKGGTIPAVYRVIRNTGPLCPIYMKKLRVVFDPNTQGEHSL